MTTSKYKFNTNLLDLSKSNDLEIAKTEWLEIYTEQRTDKSGLCICQHKIKNIIFMYNIFTKFTICVGTNCCKKFNFKINKLNNNIFKNIMVKMIKNSDYKIINNIIEYTQDIELELIKCIRNEYNNNISKLENLKELNNEIKMLIDNYKLLYLHDIYNEVSDTIIVLSRHEKEKESYIKSTCAGHGECLIQFDDENRYIKDETIYCSYNCKPNKCPVRYCKAYVPEYIMFCNNGMCMNCAVEAYSKNL